MGSDPYQRRSDVLSTLREAALTMAALSCRK